MGKLKFFYCLIKLISSEYTRLSSNLNSNHSRRLSTKIFSPKTSCSAMPIPASSSTILFMRPRVWSLPSTTTSMNPPSEAMRLLRRKMREALTIAKRPLKPYDIGKKQYTKYIKDYGKKLIDSLTAAGKSEEEITAFKAKLQAKCGQIVKNFKDYDVYITEDYNEDGMLPLLNYREDGTTPYFTYFAAGVKGVKC